MGMEVDRYAVPEVEGKPIEEIVAGLKKDISARCSLLISRTRKADRIRIGAEKAGIWESRITRIIEAKAGTFCIDDLEGLIRDCRALSDELDKAE